MILEETTLVVCEETTAVTVEVAVEVTTDVYGANRYFDEQKGAAGAKVDKGRKRLQGSLEHTLAGAANIS